MSYKFGVKTTDILCMQKGTKLEDFKKSLLFLVKQVDNSTYITTDHGLGFVRVCVNGNNDDKKGKIVNVLLSQTDYAKQKQKTVKGNETL